MRKTELGDTSLREEAIGWYHMTTQKMLVVRQQVVHILETFAGICIIWYRTLELKQRPGCSEDWQTDTHVTKNILSSQTMEHREKALENLYAFFCQQWLLQNRPAWQSTKQRPQPIMSCVTMAGNKCSPRTKRHEALEHRNLQEAMKQIHNELRKHPAGTQWETSSSGTEGIRSLFSPK